MRIILGIVLFLVSGVLAYYNVTRNDNKEITGPTLSLIFSCFVGLALLLNLNFTLLGFDSSQLDKKVEEAQTAKDDALKAKSLAEIALKETKELYALSLIRTGMLPSEESSKRDTEEARQILKSIYGDEYRAKIQALEDKGLLPSDFNP